MWYSKTKPLLKQRFLQSSHYKKIQCYLWIVLIVFSTIGCSAKQNLVFSSFSPVDKPLSGSKALSLNNQSTSCTSYLANGSLSSTTNTIRLSSGNSLGNKPAKVISYPFAIIAGGLFYRTFIVDNKPPLYVLFQKLKLCIVL